MTILVCREKDAECHDPKCNRYHCELLSKPMTDLTRIRELLAKAEKGSVRAGPWIDGLIVIVGAELHATLITPAQFAALKTEFPDKFNGEE